MAWSTGTPLIGDNGNLGASMNTPPSEWNSTLNHPSSSLETMSDLSQFSSIVPRCCRCLAVCTVDRITKPPGMSSYCALGGLQNAFIHLVVGIPCC